MPRSRYDAPVHEVKEFKEPTRTKQSQANHVNVNQIVARHQRTGVIDHWSGRVPMYGDYSLSVDLHSAMNLALQAEDMFAALPASVRKVADNDPVRFLELLAEEEGSAQLVAAGLDVAPRPGDSDYEPPEAAQEEAAAQPSPSGEAAKEA